jgi:hypothetical protein
VNAAAIAPVPIGVKRFSPEIRTNREFFLTRGARMTRSGTLLKLGNCRELEPFAVFLAKFSSFC